MGEESQGMAAGGTRGTDGNDMASVLEEVILWLVANC